MAIKLSKTGITTGQTVETWHVTQSIDSFTGVEAYDISLSGSFNMTGSINGQPGIVNMLSASYSLNSLSSSNSTNSLSSSYALTASYALNGGGSGTNKASLQFTHGTWVTASTTPHYYGNYGSSQPYPSINRIGVSSPWTGTLVSASISIFNENPGGGANLRFSVVKNGNLTPVSKSLATGLSTDSYFKSALYSLNPSDVNPFTVNVDDMLSIKIESDGTINGLNTNSTVTLIFE